MTSLLRRRSPRPAAIALLALLGLGACTGQRLTTNGPDEVEVVTASPDYQRSVTAETFQSRLAALTAAVQRLREETSTGWVGRQDGLTGYLTELSGGGYGTGDPEASAAALMEAYGRDLFGVDAAGLDLEIAEAPEGSAVVVLAGEQRAGGVPVLDGRVTVTATSGRVHAVRGRLFPGIEPPAEPVLTAKAARAAAVAAAGGRARGARLVVMPGAPGADGDWDSALAWEVTVAGADAPQAPAADVYAYVDAETGDILALRAASAEGLAAGRTVMDLSALMPLRAGQSVSGQPVEIGGPGPNGEDFTGVGLRQPDGTVALVDTTVETFDPSTGAGAIETHDGTGLGESGLPGPIMVFPGQDIPDPEAIGAHTMSRFIFDYYLAEHGRRSWDGQGGTLRSTVHFGDSSFCNAFFSLDMMVYGVPCVRGGRPANSTFIDVDVASHEITHGVTATSSGLLYSGPSGALNEAFSDYFGNVVGDRLRGQDSDTVGEGGCVGVPPSPLCQPNPDGLSGIRYMPNGTTLRDYLFILDPPLILKQLGIKQDNGGVHLNSAIWNHALWSIRRRLAQIDDTTMLDSPKVRQLDRAVYAALTRHLTPTASFLDARRAVEQALGETGAEPTVARVAREVFDASQICAACVAPPASPAVAITAAAGAQKSPTVAGDSIGWLDLGVVDEVVGIPAAARIGGDAAPVSRDGVTSLGFAGPDALLVSTFTNEGAAIVRLSLRGEPPTVLDKAAGENSAVLGVAGSNEGGAWINFANATINFVDPRGTVSSAPFPTDRAGSPISIGTGGGTVAVGDGGGNGIVWRPGSSPELLPIPGGGVAAAASANRVLFVAVRDDEYAGTAIAFDLSTGRPAILSERASALGAAISDDHAVWAESVGALSGAIGQQLSLRDTDLYLFSFESGRLYSVLPGLRGQQGFPALSGSRLAWQDAVNGGDDIYTGVLPGGL